MFIVGPVMRPIISKWSGKCIDGNAPMAGIFGILAAGLTAGPLYVPLCDATFQVQSKVRRKLMKKFMLGIVTMSLLLVAAPMAAQAGTGFAIYKPGIVKSAIANGETVLLAYLSSW